MKTRKLLARLASVACAFITAVTCSRATSICNANQTDETQTQELNEEAKFSYITYNGDEQLYNYSLLYDHSEEDLVTIQELLQNPEKVDGIHIRKLDANGDGLLTMVDYIELYKEVECPEEGFWHDGGHYSYNILDRSSIQWSDIEIVSSILARTLIPNGGAYIAKYDYNFSGDTDIMDLVLMKRYYTSNPTRFLWAYDGAYRITNEQLAELLEAADSFGIENFIIKFSSEVVPYSIISTDGDFYETRNSYTSHPMQVVPREDTTLDEYFLPEYLKDDMGDYWSLWRWHYDDDNFSEEVLWITNSYAGLMGDYSRVDPFILIPLDESGNELGCLVE